MSEQNTKQKQRSEAAYSAVLAHCDYAGLDKEGTSMEERISELLKGMRVLCEEYGVDYVNDSQLPSAEIPVDPSKIAIYKSREVSCNAKENIEYEVLRTDWEAAMEEAGDNEEHALLALQQDNKVQRVAYDCEVNEINAEFDVEVEADE